MAPTRRRRCAGSARHRALRQPGAASSGTGGTCIWYRMVPHSLGTARYRVARRHGRRRWPIPKENARDPRPTSTHVHVAIVGSGFSGLGTAIRLKQEGMDDFVVLERAGDVGGTWRDNTYPGCACDVPSHLYSFSFAPNPDWSRAFSPQPEIFSYLRHCAEHYGILPAHPLRPRRHERHVGRGRAALAHRDVEGRLHRQRRSSPPRAPSASRRSRKLPGLETLRGARVPLRALGPRRRPRRAQGRRRRHRRFGDPVRPRDPAPGRQAQRLPAHAAVDPAAQQPASIGERAQRDVPRRSPRRRSSRARRSTP